MTKKAAKKITQKRVVDPTYAKSDEYQQVLSAIASEGKCPFCLQNFKYHKNDILKKEAGWLITKSSWPYENTKHHFLIINQTHKEKFCELTLADFQAVMILINWAIKKYEIKGGGLTFRFGQTKFTGATVCHLHFHLIVPEINPETNRAKTVSFPIG
ncbi:HIT domain-containing protein [Patescibacteria group bacterium]|nr:HIT domain-containing protein [Patescibacteria group bacterium]MBU1967426.1 HIT domain-containing protein [Patescibacteria group bacterium]MBU2543804.1 HIT domain-containing protein [Patescibacteria group bacterium]